MRSARAIAIVEHVDSRFFANVPNREALRFLRRLVQEHDVAADAADKRTDSAAPSQPRRRS